MRHPPAAWLEHVVPVLRKVTWRGTYRCAAGTVLGLLVGVVLAGCARHGYTGPASDRAVGEPQASRGARESAAHPESDGWACYCLAESHPGGQGLRRAPIEVEDSLLLTGTDFLPASSRLALVGHFGPALGSKGAGDRVLLLPDGVPPNPGTPLRELCVVRGPADLTGAVRLAASADALAYVRLFTSPALARCMREQVYEVMPVGTLEREAAFGTDLGRLSLRMGGGVCGVLLDEEWHGCGLDAPTVESLPDGWFIVTRWVYRREVDGGARRRPGAASRLVELVRPDGSVGRSYTEQREVRGEHVRLRTNVGLE